MIRWSSAWAAAAVSVVVLALIAGCSPQEPAAPAPAPRSTTSDSVPGRPEVAAPPRISSSEHRGELIVDLPVRPSATSAGKRVLFSERLDLHEQQVLLATAEFQVTNQIDKNVLVASQLILGKRPDSITGVPVTPANGQNVTPAMHHGQQTKVGSILVEPADSGVRYLNLVVWAAMTTSQPGDQIRIDRGYGRLTAVLW